MISNIVKTLTLTLLAMVILSGCDSNSKSSSEDTFFRISPESVHTKTSTDVTLIVEGGTPPFYVVIYNNELGSIATPTEETYDRTIVYSAGSKTGVNTIEVGDKNFWTASARIYQHQYLININPSVLSMPTNALTQVFTVSGTSEDVNWRMTDSSLGSIKVLDEYGYMIEYTRKTKTGINILYAKDANDVENSVTITQQ